MGWLSSLLGLGGKAVRDNSALLTSVVEAVAKRAENRDAFRLALAKAAEEGDLDFVFNSLDAAKKSADDYIKNG